jgi:hypothetical protein
MTAEVYQLEFFRDEDNMITQHKLMRMDESLHRVRKALFARHGQLARNVDDIGRRLEIIERFICRPDD